MTTDRPADVPRCECGHAISQHNQLGYCRSKTTANRSGECMCDGYRSTEEAS